MTDANLLLGRMLADQLLGGALPLDVDRARGHMLKFANDLGMPADEAAEGVLKVANAAMERAIRVISVERGHDPRRFALVAFGGAGPMSACDLARSMSIPNVIVPQYAGALSALGLLLADVAKDFSQTVLVGAEALCPERLDSLFAPLERRAMGILQGEGFEPDAIGLERLLDMRYIGQSFTVTVPATGDFERTFHDEHFRLYGHSNPSRPAEAVNVRLAARGKVEPPEFARREAAGEDPKDAVLQMGTAVFDGKNVEAPVYDRVELRPGNKFAGPAIVVEKSATTVVAPDFVAKVDGYGNLILSPAAA